MKKNINIQKIVAFGLIFLYTISGKVALAQTITIPNPLRSGTNTLYSFISLIINDVILPVGGVIAVVYIIYAGFMLVSARGDETKLREGKRAFTYAAIGTLILLGAWAISQAIEGTIDQLIN